LGIPAEATVIGQVGALAPNKRPDFLIAAFGSMLQRTERKFHLCLVGAGPLESDLRRLVDDLGIASYVSLSGYVGDVLPYYQHVFDINVLASSEEGLGISVIEGSACGLPAVVTNCTGLPETIVDGATGSLFELNDTAGLCEHLLRLGTNPSVRASMGRAGRALAQERFSSTSYDRSFIAVVDDLLQRHRVRDAHSRDLSGSG
jgi:glycosyltransferase involved in cell wall biosynthesis